MMYNSYIMIRTQIYIPENLHKKLIYLAEKKNKSMAECIRIFIKEGIKKDETLDISGKDVLKKISLLNFVGGNKDMSSKIDEIIYGNGKK